MCNKRTFIEYDRCNIMYSYFSVKLNYILKFNHNLFFKYLQLSLKYIIYVYDRKTIIYARVSVSVCALKTNKK